jgi:hypothetical protein
MEHGEPHIVAVKEAEGVVEAVPIRTERRQVTEMPLPDAGGGVALVLEALREGHF